MSAIDLLAGAGGFSTDASKAAYNVAWAANRRPDFNLIQRHLANHKAIDR